MSKKVCIAFGNKARQGKDTAAWAIHRAYPRLTRVIGFADALKAYCRIEHGMREKDAPLLQRMATQFRADDPEKWIRALDHTAAEAPEPVILIPDVRYQNEAAFVQDRDGWLVKVERYNLDGSRYIATDRPADHPSETDLDTFAGWDHTIRTTSASQTVDAAVLFFENWLLNQQHAWGLIAA